MMSTDTNEIPTTTSIEAYGAYPFSSDETYQVGSNTFSVSSKTRRFFKYHSNFFREKQGLASILVADTTLDANSPPEVRDELERRTRVFYFNRLGFYYYYYPYYMQNAFLLTFLRQNYGQFNHYE